MEKQISKLKKALGKTWMFNTINYEFTGIMADKDLTSCTLITNKKEFNFNSTTELDTFLNEILPTEDPDYLPAPSFKLSKPDMDSNDTLAQLKGIIVDNITKVQKNKGYIPQAQTISKQIQTLINLTNLEMNVHKMNKK